MVIFSIVHCSHEVQEITTPTNESACNQAILCLCHYSAYCSECTKLNSFVHIVLCAVTEMHYWFHADKYVAGGGPKAAEKARILLKLMQFIGAVSGGKTVTQVALNYLMCKGTFAAATCTVSQDV